MGEKSKNGFVAAQTGKPTRSVLEQIYDCMTDGVVGFDAAGLIVFCNPAMSLLTGCPKEKLLGRTSFEAWGGENVPATQASATYTGEQQICHPDGLPRIVTVKTFLLECEPPIQVAIYRDVTRRRRAESTLNAIVGTTGLASDTDFFSSMVRELAGMLGTRYALIGTLDTEDPLTLHVSACWANGKQGGPFSHNLAGTPCEQMAGQTICHHPAGVRKLFPNDAFLQEHRIESYLGAVLTDSTGHAIGLLVAMDEKPFRVPFDAKGIISFFAARAGGELCRRRAEAALRESEARYRALVEQSRDGFYIRDLESGKFLYANEAATRISGFPAEEILQRSPMDFVAPEARADVARHAEEMMQTRVAVPVTFPAVRHDGSRFIAEVSPMFVQFRGRTCLQGTIRDVTDRIRGENERETMARFSMRLAGSDSLEALVDVMQEESFRLLGWDAFFLVIHLPGEEKYRVVRFIDTVDGKQTAFPGGELSDAQAGTGISQVLAGKPTLANRVGGVGAPKPRPFGNEGRLSESLMYAPVRSGNRVIGIVSAQSYATNRYADGDLQLLQRIADIVAPAIERCRAEMDVRESEERHRRLVELSPNCIAVIQDGKLVYINPAGVQLCGANSPAELLSIPAIELLAKENRYAMRKRVERVKREGVVTPPVVFKVARRDGTFVEVESRENPTQYEGKPAVQVEMQDITERRRAEERLRRSEQQLLLLFQQTPLGMIRWDMRFRISEWNPAAEKIFGYSREEALGRHALGLIVPSSAHDSVEHTWRELVSKRGGFRATNPNITRDGRTIMCEWYNTPLIDSRGKVVGVASMVQDITERLRTEQALRESEERFSLAVSGANDGIWDWNLKSGEMYFSPRWKAMLGLSEDEIGSSPNDWFHRIHPDDLANVKGEIAVHIEGASPHLEVEYRIRHRDGAYRWMLCRGIAVRDEEDIPCRIAGSLTDITERKRVEEQLLHDAFHDALTSLPNRALFMEHLERSIGHTERDATYHFALLFLDIDRFKLVNDSMGHMAGDELLVAIAQRLRVTMRPGDVLARLGGDEFAVLLDDITEPAFATVMAKQIQEQLAAPFVLNVHEVFVTASIGIALDTTGYRRPEEMLRDADTAMYRAKALGKARWEIFDSEMRTRVQHLLQMETDLRRAVERGQFEVHYQPIVRMRDRTVRGFEAIVRWHHPRRGIIQPAEFLPLAEETGLVTQIGAFVTREACAQLRKWNDAIQAAPLLMSVNISGHQFARQELLEQVDNVIAASGINPGNLMFEITESVLLADWDLSISLMQALKERGIKLAIDDFGTGYSSLSYLHRFPVDTLKIDRSFVAAIGTVREKPEIIRTVLALARDLRLDIVAEGVETTAQFQHLLELGCEYAQGFLFAKPLTAREATGFLNTRVV